MSVISEQAWAKVNLSLSVLGRRADGYHELASVVAFAADIFDTVTFFPGEDLAVELTGPFAAKVCGPNLIEQAARTLAAAHTGLQLGRFHVEKRIPVSAGIGGGSADAAATLRLLAVHNRLGDPDRAMRDLAATIGADVPVCLAGGRPAAAFMSGIGEQVVSPTPDGLLGACDVTAVLVNPGVAVATGSVFRALGAAPLSAPMRSCDAPERFSDNAALFAYLDTMGNDLEAPAIGQAPVISDVLAALGSLESCRLARMSGSGATCFGLFETRSAADAAAERLRTQSPSWWIAVSRFT